MTLVLHFAYCVAMVTGLVVLQRLESVVIDNLCTKEGHVNDSNFRFRELRVDRTRSLPACVRSPEFFLVTQLHYARKPVNYTTYGKSVRVGMYEINALSIVPTKVQIERNNLQLELLRYRILFNLFTSTFAKRSMQYHPMNAYIRKFRTQTTSALFLTV